MVIAKTPTEHPFPLRESDQPVDFPTTPVDRYSPMPDATLLRNTFLFGLPLKSALTNQEMSDDSLNYFIKNAISELEHTLDIYISPIRFEGRYDYERHQTIWSYGYLRLDHPNVLYVEEVKLSFNNDPAQEGMVNFPLEFVYVNPHESSLQLVPAYGQSFSGFLLSAYSGVQYHALQHMGALTSFPGGIHIKSVHGFEKDKIPAVISELIALSAAIQTISALGPVFQPYNSVSIGIDGTSQSTGAAGINWFATRMKELQDQYQQKLQIAQNYYKRSFLVDFV